jgi:iron complex transport system ATP-binding protein
MGKNRQTEPGGRAESGEKRLSLIAMTDSNIAIDLRNVTVKRGNRTILADINWTVRKGQHWTILGANGSGKTSLLNTLTAYLTISKGEFELLGHKYGTTDWREVRKKTGLISESIMGRIGNKETCIEIIASGKHAMINYWGLISEEEYGKGLEILRKIECAHLAEDIWATLSQGEKQRLLIGRALMADLNILILDEPCAGLDPAARENFLAFLNRLAEDDPDLVLLLVTHHVEEITPIFSHVLLLKEGKVLASGEKENTLNSAMLSKVFNTEVELKQNNSRYSMAIRTRDDAVV